MKLFLDTAELRAFRALWEIGIFAGMTTNPVILARASMSPGKLAEALKGWFQGMVFFQASGASASELADDARRLEGLLPGQVIVKIPSVPHGFAAISMLEREGIRTAATALFTAGQGVAATLAGASVIIPFCDRLERAGGNYVRLLEDLVGLQSSNEEGKPKVLAASLKNLLQFESCLRAGLWGVTVSPDLAQDILSSNLTEEAVKKFNDAASHAEE